MTSEMDKHSDMIVLFGSLLAHLKREDWGVVVNGKAVQLPEDAVIIILDKAIARVAQEVLPDWEVREIMEF
jgi:hypothetical protein